MNPYQFEVRCDVCGEPGMGTIQATAAAWLPGHSVRHRDPAVCAANLKRRKAELDRREAELNTQGVNSDENTT